MKFRSNRREFLKHNVAAGVGVLMAGRAARGQSPNERLQVASIGAGGQGNSNLRRIAGAGAEIVALCEVDDTNRQFADSLKRFPDARRFYDFREMFDVMHKDIDAVVVSTPDHTHAVATMAAIKLGKHVYTEKPLTHSVREARMLAEAAEKYKVVTQMGNQGTATDGMREAVEVIQSGALGPVREAHCWTNRPGRWWQQGGGAVLALPAVQHALHGKGDPQQTPPDTLNWDLWLGPAPVRPYQPNYLPKAWRGWWDFGCGALGDMACHTANVVFMGLKLGPPSSVEATVSEYNDETFPLWSVIRYEFPARGAMPPLTFTWYDGGDNKPAWVNNQLQELIGDRPVPASGVLLIGDKGKMFSPHDYGSEYTLSPEKDFADYQPPTPWLPRVGGAHHEEWVRACLANDPEMTMSNFAYAGPFTEAVLLGCVAMRAREKILWDGPGLKITSPDSANEFLHREYRPGWTL